MSIYYTNNPPIATLETAIYRQGSTSAVVKRINGDIETIELLDPRYVGFHPPEVSE